MHNETDKQKRYSELNSRLHGEAEDPFTLARYRQFSKYLPKDSIELLDVGSNDGRGGG